jgi:hypothetical protein
MFDEIELTLHEFVGKECWFASNAIVGAIRLYFGGAVLSRGIHSEMYYVGQYDVLVWCQWRLDDGDVSLCSWDNSHETINQIIFCLVGDTLTSIKIIPPFGDAEFTFSSGKTLRVFCNEVQGDDNSFNWSFGLIDEEYYIGINGKLESGKKLGIVPGPVVDPSTTTDYESKKLKDFGITPPSFKTLDKRVIKETEEQFKNLIGKLCHTVDNIDEWILQLDFGGYIKRSCTEKERIETGKEFCDVGELDILIWCVWRLQDSDGAVCSSESPPEQQKEGTKRLIGETVVAVDLFSPAWDAVIRFSSGLVLQIFCNYTHFSEMETNWFFRNGWKLYCFNRCDDIEKAKIN